MKILLDSCIWSRARPEIEAAGHDVLWAGDWPEDPGDEQILARAHAEGRVLVTLDKDFGELAIVAGQPHAGIVRLVGLRAVDQARAEPARDEERLAEDPALDLLRSVGCAHVAREPRG